MIKQTLFAATLKPYVLLVIGEFIYCQIIKDATLKSVRNFV